MLSMAKHVPDEKLNRADGGFSLLEVIISMAILALVTIPLLNYFTDSLKHSARMAQQQRGTLAAQELTEGMKSVDKLIGTVSGGDAGYTVPYLVNLFGSSLVKDGSFDSEGKGTVTYEGKLSLDSGEFYARVKVSTSVAANAVTRPLIYGIDDSTDMLALERNQETEALVYFTSVNTVYCASHSGTMPLTQDEIKANLKRTIYVDIDYDETYYYVKVYYSYTCSGLCGDDALGKPIESSFTSSCLVDSKIDTLKNLYLLYTCQSDSDKIVLDIHNAEKMKIFPEKCMKKGSDLIEDNSTRIGLYLVAQGLDEEAKYELSINGYQDKDYTSIHTNIVGQKHSIVNGDTTQAIVPFVMMTSGTPTRLINITTEIYENKESTSGDPLAIVETTKGE